MGRHRRSGRSYGYRSVRLNGRVQKIYVGSGALEEFASRLGNLRDYNEERTRRCWNSDKQLIEAAFQEFHELDKACDMLRDAAFLASGFYKHHRHPWRKRQRGRRVFRHKESE